MLGTRMLSRACLPLEPLAYLPVNLPVASPS
jgi:hypothetical protein